ncbi:hypothetical protein BDM02DRAFT_3114563 [Thelephora ganbajun]|uniref:Uncharacterized protein n=1 Tax=Thelephora ganbajun TaxID=370292 RepID=A0ACB6ZIP4_THEGA|nr:hypothetical protein BDM02DRAFT_3114563 [Thelephora ganbajun]
MLVVLVDSVPASVFLKPMVPTPTTVPSTTYRPQLLPSLDHLGFSTWNTSLSVTSSNGFHTSNPSRLPSSLPFP